MNKQLISFMTLTLMNASMLASCGTDTAFKRGQDIGSGTTEREVSVHHEWGKLREAIVGRGDELVIPSYSAAVSFIYDPEYLDMMKEYGGRRASEVDPQSTKKLIEQIEGLVRVLEERGIIVHRPHHLTPEEMKYMEDVQKGSMFIFARDPVLVIGNNVIETAIKIPMRAKERYGIRPILRKRLKNSNARYVAVPAVSPAFSKDGIYLEGGDVLLNGYDIYVGNSGRGSNNAGIEWLQEYLGPRYRVQEVKLEPKWEHLDCVLSLVRPGLGVIHRDGIVGELPESIRDWDYVEVNEDEARRLAVNLLVLDDKTVIIDRQHHRIGEELRKRGVEVIEIPYDEVATWGGAFRCSHHPLLRESLLNDVS